MKKLLSLPPNVVDCFHEIADVPADEYFCTSDPAGSKLGSGGGTVWLLRECHRQSGGDEPFGRWLSREKRILIHAGGQSRRLPAYASGGKVLTPIPVFRWARGQRLGQTLLELQLPLYEQIMEKAPADLHTMVVSGDVLIRSGKLQAVPEADVVCYGIWADPSLACNHGVFVASRQQPGRLDYMLQKPSAAQLRALMQTHFFLMDVGIWLLSDKAVERLVRKSMPDGGRKADGEDIRDAQEAKSSPQAAKSSLQNINTSPQNTNTSPQTAGTSASCPGLPAYYDLYSDFGRALGAHPSAPDDVLADLTVAIVPLQDGEFYHYGTSREMISSTVAIQNLVYDQRAIMHLDVKPHPSIFVQNAALATTLTPSNENVWVENSRLGAGWTLAHHHVITGVPANDWSVRLEAGVCVDVVPVGEADYALRPYGFHDAFRGAMSDPAVTYLNRPAVEWLSARALSASDIALSGDMQSARLFPVSASSDELGAMLCFMTEAEGAGERGELWRRGRSLWTAAAKLSADELAACANLRRLSAQRRELRAHSWGAIARNHRQSVFYQLNLEDAAREFASMRIAEPEPLTAGEPLLKRISDQMFRSRLHVLRGEDGAAEEAEAFRLLRQGLTASARERRQEPRLAVCSDQIVWGRSPVRIDMAGGWSDTPPYCLTNGGNVVNIAVELNGQPPLQVFVKPCREFRIILRSIDLGAVEVVETYDELRDVARVGSPFSIPKCALCLAGFSPEFGQGTFDSLASQLASFGCGIELTLLSAVPAGSGLGTSSILAATVLGALSDFCSLGWDQAEVSGRTLVLEQLLTTGGGWQDQFGGVLPGVKLLQTQPGFDQTPQVRWMPDSLFTEAEYAPCHLLYYTGLTRTAKSILADIVRGMFLAETRHLGLLGEMKAHALDLYEAIQQKRFGDMGRAVRKNWLQNQALDGGTNPPAVRALTSLIDDLCLGYKLPGAGGGGYLYMIAKDAEAAARVRRILNEHRPNERARFVEMTLSLTGFQVSRS